MDATGFTPHGNAVGLAATVVLLRDSPRGGLEVLLLERPHHRGSFAGAWVFPGGAVELGDLAEPAGAVDAVAAAAAVGPGGASGARPELLELDLAAEQAASRRAAVRETWEETGLTVPEHSLVPLSRWHPPRESPKRLRTWFYLAEAPVGEVVLEPFESVDFRWLSPGDALELHQEERLLLMPPTWLALHGLRGFDTAAAALDAAERRGLAEFASRFIPGVAVSLWHPDSAYGELGERGGVDPERLDVPGARHRLDMRARPWRYLRDAD